MPVQSAWPMCQDVVGEVTRQVRRLHSAEWNDERSIVAGSVSVTWLIELASSVTEVVRVQVCAAPSVIASCSTTLPPQNDPALSARFSVQLCGTVAPEAIVPIASAPVGATVTVAAGGADTTLRVAATRLALAQPMLRMPTASVAVSRRSRNASASQPPDRTAEAMSTDGTPAAPMLAATSAKSWSVVSAFPGTPSPFSVWARTLNWIGVQAATPGASFTSSTLLIVSAVALVFEKPLVKLLPRQVVAPWVTSRSRSLTR